MAFTEQKFGVVIKNEAVAKELEESLCESLGKGTPVSAANAHLAIIAILKSYVFQHRRNTTSEVLEGIE